MKKILLGMTAILCATTTSAQTTDSLKNVELQDVQVMSIRADKKTPVAFSNLDKQALQQVNFGKDIPYLLSMTPSVTMSSDAGTGI